jgi:hypothetical protein
VVYDVDCACACACFGGLGWDGVLVFAWSLMICCPHLMMPWWGSEMGILSDKLAIAHHDPTPPVLVWLFVQWFEAIDPEELCAHSELFGEVPLEPALVLARRASRDIRARQLESLKMTSALPLHEFTSAIRKMAPVWSQGTP